MMPLMQFYDAQTSVDARYLAITRFLEALYSHPDSPWVFTQCPRFHAVAAEKCRQFLGEAACGPALRLLILAMQGRFDLG